MLLSFAVIPGQGHQCPWTANQDVPLAGEDSHSHACHLRGHHGAVGRNWAFGIKG